MTLIKCKQKNNLLAFHLTKCNCEPCSLEPTYGSYPEAVDTSRFRQAIFRYQHSELSWKLWNMVLEKRRQN